MFRVAYRLAGSSAEAEEIVQDCLATVASGGGQFDPGKGTARPYLLAAVRNRALRRAHHREVAGEFPEVADWHTPENALFRGEVQAAVAKAVGRLPFVQREALILAHYEQMSAREIAEIVGADVGAVKSRLQRARATLRETLAAYRNEEVKG
jgi:RNA polymerase sigma-70 factor (ECF subfamily)